MGRPKHAMRHSRRIAPLNISRFPDRPPPSEEAVESLAQSMDWQGQREPVLVTPIEDDGAGRKPVFQLVHGYKRLLAAKKLKWRELDCIVLGPEFKQDFGVIQRLEQEGFEPWELAETLQKLRTECGWTQTQLGLAIGKSRDFVANILAIINIAPEVQRFIRDQKAGYTLTARHLRYIGRANPEQQMEVAREMLSERLSTKTLQERRKTQPGPRRSYLKSARGRRTPSRQPKTVKDWQKLYQKTNAELKKLEKQENEEMNRIDRVIKKAKERRLSVYAEAKEKRRLLLSQQRQAGRKLGLNRKA